MHGPTEQEENGQPKNAKDGLESVRAVNAEMAREDTEPMAQNREEVSH